MTARSALGMRAALSWGALVAGVLGAVLILALVPSGAAGGVRTIGAVVCALVVVVAVIDLVVISRRRRQRR